MVPKVAYRHLLCDDVANKYNTKLLFSRILTYLENVAHYNEFLFCYQTQVLWNDLHTPRLRCCLIYHRRTTRYVRTANWWVGFQIYYAVPVLRRGAKLIITGLYWGISSLHAQRRNYQAGVRDNTWIAKCSKGSCVHDAAILEMTTSNLNRRNM